MAIPPKRVVITSSVAAIAFGQTSSRDNPFSEQSHTVLNNPKIPVSAYGESKTLAERAAWDFVQGLPPDQTFELCTINPVLVQGPMLNSCTCSSAEIIKKILLRDTIGLPDIQMDLVHVFDVAKVRTLDVYDCIVLYSSM
jgi:nucleoside-diphosphate-sugar epimerase